MVGPDLIEAITFPNYPSGLRFPFITDITHFICMASYSNFTLPARSLCEERKNHSVMCSVYTFNCLFLNTLVFFQSTQFKNRKKLPSL